MAETFAVAMPFLVITLEGGLRALDTRFEDAAATLGAGPVRDVLEGDSVPLLKPSLYAGNRARLGTSALGEFRRDDHLRRQYPREGPRRLRLAVYNLLEDDPPAAIALSVLLLAVSARGVGVAS